MRSITRLRANYSARGGGVAEGTSRAKTAKKNIASATRVENAGKKNEFFYFFYFCYMRRYSKTAPPPHFRWGGHWRVSLVPTDARGWVQDASLPPPGVTSSSDSERFVADSARSFFIKGETPESGIPPSYRATRRYTKVHLDVCLRFSTMIGQRGREVNSLGCTLWDLRRKRRRNMFVLIKKWI